MHIIPCLDLKLRIAYCSRLFPFFHFHLPSSTPYYYLSSDRDLNLDTGLNVDDYLLYDLGRCIQINQALVDSHLVHIPCLASLTAGCLSGGDFEGLCGETDGALDAQILGFGALEELGADLFERLHFSAR